MKNSPKFKYQPNIYDNDKVPGGVVYAHNTCQCCHGEVDVYVDHMYSPYDIDCICMDCISNGSAAAKFRGSFIDSAEDIHDDAKREELYLRTPGFTSCQGEYWLSCCSDYCAFLGNVGFDELTQMDLTDLIDEYIESEKVQINRESLSKSGSPGGYLFRCLHCGKYRLHIDYD